LFGPRPDFGGDDSKNAVGGSGHSYYIPLDSGPRRLCQVRRFYLSIGRGALSLRRFAEVTMHLTRLGGETEQEDAESDS
jgi:hypothetical protein